VSVRVSGAGWGGRGAGAAGPRVQARAPPQVPQGEAGRGARDSVPKVPAGQGPAQQYNAAALGGGPLLAGLSHPVLGAFSPVEAFWQRGFRGWGFRVSRSGNLGCRGFRVSGSGEVGRRGFHSFYAQGITGVSVFCILQTVNI
jgi:hypothetical protein